LLKERLGHLTPSRMALELPAVRAAIQAAPKLHRYVENVPRWVVAAAARVMDSYGGKVENMWADQPTGAALQKRWDEFTGIGQKKAAMAVQILSRNLQVPVSEMSGS